MKNPANKSNVKRMAWIVKWRMAKARHIRNRFSDTQTPYLQEV